MSDLVFAYGSTDETGKVWLANTATAEILKAKCKGKPVYRVRMVSDEEDAHGFLMHKEAERRGFIFYPEERRRAEIEAMEFTERFGRAYKVSPIRLTNEKP